MHVLGGAPAAWPKPQRVVLPLLASQRESPTAMTFHFAREGSGFRYLSNQAVRLALPGVDDPWGAVRTFSLSSSPTETDRLSVTCRISDTPFKQALARLRPGETAEIVGPLGNFLLAEDRPAVFLAGGIGVTPFRGMLRYAADRSDPQPRRLLYTARVPEELVFRQELDALAGAHPNLRVEYAVTRPDRATSGWEGRVGRLDAAWIRAQSEDLPRPKFYLAGLPAMVTEVVAILRGPLGVPEEDLAYEVFRGF